GDDNHSGSTDAKTFAITKASSPTTGTCAGDQVYTGSAIATCSATVTGANLSLTPTPAYADNIAVGTATASYSYGGDDNHSGSSDAKTFGITKASSTTTVTCTGDQVYTGSAL